MDYEQKYKEALNLAKSYYENHEGGANQFLDTIFPELAESEDERIRRKFIEALKGCGFTHFDNDFTVQEAITWLEKQGEQKPFDYENANILQKDFAPKTEPKFKVGDLIKVKDMIEIKLYRFLNQCECHWVNDQHDDVYVNLGIQDVDDLWRLLLNHKSIYDDGGFDSEIKDGYIILKSFNQILDHFSIDPKSFYEELKIED